MRALIASAGVVLFTVGLYLLYRGIRNTRRFLKVTGKKWTSLPFLLPFYPTNPQEEEAWKRLKKESVDSMLIWISSIVVVMSIYFTIAVKLAKAE